MTASGKSPYHVRYSDTGACLNYWAKKTEAELLDEFKELLIQLAASGGDMSQIIKEAGKIRQFAALGAESFYIARSLALALVGAPVGAPCENLSLWARFKR